MLKKFLVSRQVKCAQTGKYQTIELPPVGENSRREAVKLAKERFRLKEGQYKVTATGEDFSLFL